MKRNDLGNENTRFRFSYLIVSLVLVTFYPVHLVVGFLGGFNI